MGPIGQLAPLLTLIVLRAAIGGRPADGQSRNWPSGARFKWAPLRFCRAPPPPPPQRLGRSCPGEAAIDWGLKLGANFQLRVGDP